MLDKLWIIQNRKYWLELLSCLANMSCPFILVAMSARFCSTTTNLLYFVFFLILPGILIYWPVRRIFTQTKREQIQRRPCSNLWHFLVPTFQPTEPWARWNHVAFKLLSERIHPRSSISRIRTLLTQTRATKHSSSSPETL